MYNYVIEPNKLIIDYTRNHVGLTRSFPRMDFHHCRIDAMFVNVLVSVLLCASGGAAQVQLTSQGQLETAVAACLAESPAGLCVCDLASPCGVATGPIGTWDVSGVTNMRGLFSGAGSFNGDISGWDVSNITNMSRIFQDTNTFDQAIGAWDVSNVTNMQFMFLNAVSFNQDIGAWNVSRVTDMSYMFNFASEFNQPLLDWDVSSVTAMNGRSRCAAGMLELIEIGNADFSNHISSLTSPGSLPAGSGRSSSGPGAVRTSCC